MAYNKPSPWIESTSTEGIEVFESRRLIMNDVMEALKDDRFHMIAICGMGGVGKTTMVKEVAKRAKEEKLFDEVVMAVVSQSPNERKIQGEIGDKLGLKFEEETECGRADRLCERLRGTRRILVILDDVWKRLELNDVGIPFGDGHRGCKILLTSRFDNVCNHMNAQKKFTVEVLTEEEAWNLFEEMAGISNDTSHTSIDLYIIQKKVVDECGCLPIAIVTIARALKDKDRHSWHSALLQLRKSMVKNIRGVEEKVFKSLELSYHFLGNKEIKEFFLLCSLYAKDFNIPIEDLVRYGVGIELFEAIDSVDEARDRVHAFVDDLKKCYLLMDGEREGYVKMHAVVRDVAISIASREEHSFMVRCDQALKELMEKQRHKNYAVISLRYTGMSELPDNLEFPKLHLLRLEHSYASELPNLPDSFYGGMRELKALSMLNVYIEGSLPTSLRWLTNLRSLSLYECRLINDVSVIGALKNLEILSFEGTKIEELPKEIGWLSHLKLLDLWRCGVKRICTGVLSSLSKLEELYLGSSLNDEHRIEETKATFTELCGLSNFTTLVIYLDSFAYWPRDLVLTNLTAFVILTGLGFYRRLFGHQLRNQLSLEDLHESDLMEITQILEITRAVGDFDEDGFKILEELFLKDCQDLEYVIDTTDGVPIPQIDFPGLQSLRLDNLDKLKEICHGQLPEEAFSALKRLELRDLPALTHLWKGPTQLVQLRNLTFLKLERCDKLESIFSLSIARDLMQLQILYVSECRKMEVLISSEEEGDQNEIAKLNNFCNISDSNYDTIQPLFNKVAFSALEELQLKDLPTLTHLWKGPTTQLARLYNLTSLKLNRCDKLESMFSLCIARDLMQLQILSVSECRKMEVLISSEEEGDQNEITSTTTDKIVFPKLKELCLGCLPSFIAICKVMNGIELLQLNKLILWEMPKLHSFCNTSDSNYDAIQPLFNKVIFPALEELRIDRLPKITEIWYRKLLPSESFRQLRYMTISNCQELKVIVLENGEEEVKVENNNNAISFPQLMSLTLEHLQSLESFCTSRSETQSLFTSQVAFPALEELLVSGVPNITEIWVNAKKTAMAQEKKRNVDVITFPRLRTVRLDNLQNLEIFCRTRRFETQTLFNHQIACPELRVLVIGWVPNITDVWDKKLLPTGSFCKLEKVRIEGCDKLVNVILSNMLPRLQNLTELSVQYCPMVEEILSEKGDETANAEAEENIILFPLLKTLELGSLENLKSFCTSRLAAQHFFKHPVAFASLKELHICNLPNITEIWGKQLLPVPKTDSRSFEKLDVVNATWCEKLVNVIPSSMFPRLKNLKSIYVKGCPEMKVIVSKKANATVNGDIIFFPRLRSLSIDKLYNLKSFCSSSTSSEAQPLFNDQVVFLVLEDLFIYRVRNITKIWDKLHSRESFCLLKHMMIEDCEKLVNVVPSYMLPQLRNLEVLNVYSRLKMLTIVSEEEGKEKDIDENTILFPQLTTMNLESLDNLKTFYPQLFLNYQVALPKLKNPCIDQYLQRRLLKGKECAIMNENDDKEIEQDKQRLLKVKEFEIMNENDDEDTEQDKRRRLKGKEFRNYE